MALQFRHGRETDLLASNLQTGEPAYCDDTQRLYIGDPDGAVRIADKDYVDGKVSTVTSGTPRGAYATPASLQAAYSAGTGGIFVVVADNKWYYWSGSAWTAGGTYISNISDFNAAIPLVTATYSGGTSDFTATLPSGMAAPSALSAGYMLRVNFATVIIFSSNGGGASLKISGMSSMYQIIANVGTAYYGKTINSGVYLLIFDGTHWVIQGIEKQVGCDYSNPLYILGQEVSTRAYADDSVTTAISTAEEYTDGILSAAIEAASAANSAAASANAAAATANLQAAAYEAATHENTVVELTDARHDNINGVEYSNIGDRFDSQSDLLSDMVPYNIDRQIVYGQEYLSAFHKKIMSRTTNTLLAVFSGDSTTAGDATTAPFHLDTLFKSLCDNKASHT